MTADVVIGGPVVLEARDDAGSLVCRFDLGHGADPAVELAARGWHVSEVVGARRLGEPVLITVTVEPLESSGAVASPEVAGAVEPAPQRRPVDLAVGPGERAVRVQRVAAYGIVISTRGLLATQYSGLVSTPGLWGLPGGGLDAGEDPAGALVRECREETGQDVLVRALDHVACDHWVGRSPRLTLEDFHAVRLIYRADCAQPGDPVVEDVGGTTSAARWVPLGRLSELNWSAFSVRTLTRLGLLGAAAQS